MKKERKFRKCPVCGVNVNAYNLAEHLRSVHKDSIDGGASHGRAKTNPLKVDTGNGWIVDTTACEAALVKGAGLIASRKFKRAIKVLKPIPEEYSDIDNVYMLIGTSYIQLNRLDDAFTYFEKAVKSDPDYPAHWFNLGYAYLHKGYIAKSRECLHKTLALNPDREVKDKTKELLDGIKAVLEQELANKPGIDPETYSALEERFRRGIDFMINDDWDAAIEEFQYVASIDNTSAKAYGNLGLTYILKGEFTEAEKHLKKSLDIDPSYKPALVNYRALKKVKKKVERDPDYLANLKDKLKTGYF